MKRLMAAGVALVAMAASGAAFAADLGSRPVYKAPMATPPAGWTGFYVGGNVGYGWQDPTVSFTGTDRSGAAAALLTGGFGGTAAPPASYGIGGVTGGVQFGYNWQFDRRWVVGFETDFNGSGISGSGASTFNAALGTPATIADRQSLDWFGTVRARLGVLATDQLLIYGTGGLAYGRVKENTSLTSPLSFGLLNVAGDFNCTAGQPCFSGSSSRIATGWTAGVGAEYAVTQSLTVKAEYLYFDLGGGDAVNVVATSPTPGSLPSTFSASHSRMDFNIVRVGANYRF